MHYIDLIKFENPCRMWEVSAFSNPRTRLTIQFLLGVNHFLGSTSISISFRSSPYAQDPKNHLIKHAERV
jgi:hypothetical protein